MGAEMWWNLKCMPFLGKMKHLYGAIVGIICLIGVNWNNDLGVLED